MGYLSGKDFKAYQNIVRQNKSSRELYNVADNLYKKGQKNLSYRVKAEALKRKEFGMLMGVMKRCGGRKAQAMAYIEKRLDEIGGI